MDDIVGKRVSKESVKLGRLKHLLDQHVLRRLLSAAEALLDDVGAELLLGQLANTTLEHSNERLGEDRLVEIKDVLHDVVAEWVLHQNVGIVGDLSDQPSLLLTRGMIDTTLENAATVAMGADINAVSSDRVKDELRVNRSELVETLLDDVVTVEVLDELNDAVAKSADDDLNLSGGGDELDHLLQSPSAVLIESDADKVVRRVLDQNSALFVVTVLEKLLAEVVTERVGHELDNMLVGLKPDHVDLLRVAVLKLLLKVSAAVLILAQSIDLATKLLKRHVGESVHGCG